MSNFIIAAAQIGAVKGDIAENIERHLKLVRLAAANQVRMVVFPELSLTGYEPELVGELAMEMDDPRLAPLKQAAVEHDLVIVAGTPLRNHGAKPYIGFLVLDPVKTTAYHKYHLHPGEERYFIPGESESHLIHRDGETIGLAICYDVNHPSHATAAAESGATIYAAGVLMMSGYGDAVKQMQQYARQHHLAVLMANYNAPTGGYIPAGQSAVWDNMGNLLAKASQSDDALVLLVRQGQEWSGKVVSIEMGGDEMKKISRHKRL